MKFLSKILGRPGNERPMMLLVVGHAAPDAKCLGLRRKKSLDQISSFLNNRVVRNPLNDRLHPSTAVALGDMRAPHKHLPLNKKCGCIKQSFLLGAPLDRIEILSILRPRQTAVGVSSSKRVGSLISAWSIQWQQTVC